ncbi:MAG: avidin/streptavidin family protein [Rhizomicrobium sp.]
MAAISKAKLARLSEHGIREPDLHGSWANELGSRMIIVDVNGKSFAGDYKSKDVDGNWITGSLSGTLAGDTVGFTVNWQPTYDSVTSWSGKLSADEVGNIYIHTLWLLASGDENLPLWESISAGADVFWRQ